MRARCRPRWGWPTYGFGHQLSAGNRIADDFTISGRANWTIETITFFAYQTGSTTTSTITAAEPADLGWSAGQPGEHGGLG